MRGQADSPFSPGLKLDMNLIVEDASRLLTELNPLRPILVGLSIGGLFAATTWLKGADATDQDAHRSQRVNESWENIYVMSVTGRQCSVVEE